jgi:small subunit ribosomal protein S5
MRSEARTEPRGEVWAPKTRLGKKVLDGEIKSVEELLASNLPLKEPEIVDHLLELEDEVIDVRIVQRMTDSGRRMKARVAVIVGNGNGILGFGVAKGKEVGPTIQRAVDHAKLNIFDVKRGCGSWECGCGRPHSLAMRTMGRCGSVEVTMKPAPRGVGLVIGGSVRPILKLAGIDDVWSFSRGNTRCTFNFAKATVEALRNCSRMKEM